METFSHSYIDILISVVLALIMFGLGLSLTFSHFRNIAKQPKALFVGLASQMIALPVIAFLILLFSDLPDVYKVGIVILAVCPGGTTSGFVTYLFRGNVALSISLTVINSVLTLFTIPLIVNMALNIFMGQEVELHLPILESIYQIFMITVLPAFLGVLFRTLKPSIAHIVQKPLKYVMIVLLALVYLIKFFAGDKYGGSGIEISEFYLLLPYVLIFNVLCYGFSIAIGKFADLRIRDAFTIAIEVALHNTTLALLVASTLLNNEDMAKPAMIYLLFSFWTALIFGYLTIKFKRSEFEEDVHMRKHN